MHNSARVFSLHQACYELRICQHPPRQARPGQASIAQRVQAISQPAIRAAALRYLTTVAATLRPNTVGLRADSLIVFSEYLSAAHPEVRSLTQLNREHIEGFLAHNHKRPWRGRVARDQPVSAVVSKRTVIDLRCFFDDLALWGWAERPPAAAAVPRRHPPAGQAAAPRPAAGRRPGPDGRHQRAGRPVRPHRADRAARHRHPPRRAARPRAGLHLGLRQPRQLAEGPARQARHRADRAAGRAHPGRPGRMDDPPRPAAGPAASPAEPARRLPVHRARPPPDRLPAAPRARRRRGRRRAARPRRADRCTSRRTSSGTHMRQA